MISDMKSKKPASVWITEKGINLNYWVAKYVTELHE